MSSVLKLCLHLAHILPIAHANFTAALSLLEEAVRLARLDHEHIVQVYGMVVMHAQCPTTALVLQTAQTTLYDCLWRIVGVHACAPISVCTAHKRTTTIITAQLNTHCNLCTNGRRCSIHALIQVVV